MSSDSDGATGVYVGTFPPAPWPLVAMAAVVMVAGLIMTFIGAGQTGLSQDEEAHVDRLDAFIEDGLYVRDHERATVAEGDIPANAYVYAPGTARVMHVVNKWIGHERDGELSKSAEAFAVRHYVVAGLAALAVLAVFGLVWLMIGTWRWGLVGSAALTAVPMWTGYAMFNPKDTPVGVGYVLMTLGFAGIVTGARCSGGRRIGAVGASVAAVVLGVALMVGTRPGMWLAVVLATAITLGFLAAGRSLDRWALVGLAAGLGGSYVALLKIAPRVFSDPATMMRVSVGQSTAFPQGITPGREHVFQHTVIEWPLLLLTFMIIGTVVAGWLCVRLLKSDPRRATVFALVGAQGYALTVGAIITKANLYDGLRQLLFAVPAQAALAAVGMATVIGMGRAGVVRRILICAAVLALGLPMIVQARLYPYQYGYGNVAAELLGAPILDDHWKVSFREHVEEISPTLRAICPFSTPEGPINSDFAPDCRESRGVIQPHWLAYWHHARYNPDEKTFYTVLRARQPFPTNCHVVQDVTRYRNFERVIMSRLLKCTTDHPGLSGDGGPRW